MVGECGQNGLSYNFLGGEIGLGDEIGRPLLGGRWFFRPIPGLSAQRRGRRIRRCQEIPGFASFWLRLYGLGAKKTGKLNIFCFGGEKFVLNSLHDRETWYHQDRWFWPLLCSGPAVSLPSERRGFFVLRWVIQSRSRFPRLLFRCIDVLANLDSGRRLRTVGTSRSKGLHQFLSTKPRAGIDRCPRYAVPRDAPARCVVYGAGGVRGRASRTGTCAETT